VMKLLRYGPPGQELPGLLDTAGQIRSLSGIIDDVAGDALGGESLDRLRRLDPASLPRIGPASGGGPEQAPGTARLAGPTRVGPCVGRVGKLMCIGLNYADHAAETGAKLPAEPVLFLKATSAICGPYDDLQIPRGSTKTDWEVELGI